MTHEAIYMRVVYRRERAADIAEELRNRSIQIRLKIQHCILKNDKNRRVLPAKDTDYYTLTFLPFLIKPCSLVANIVILWVGF